MARATHLVIIIGLHLLSGISVLSRPAYWSKKASTRLYSFGSFFLYVSSFLKAWCCLGPSWVHAGFPELPPRGPPSPRPSAAESQSGTSL